MPRNRARSRVMSEARRTSSCFSVAGCGRHRVVLSSSPHALAKAPEHRAVGPAKRGREVAELGQFARGRIQRPLADLVVPQGVGDDLQAGVAPGGRGGVPVGGVLAADQIDQAVADGHRHPALEPDGEVIETLSRSRGEGARLRQGNSHPVLEQVVPSAGEAREVGDRMRERPLRDRREHCGRAAGIVAGDVTQEPGQRRGGAGDGWCVRGPRDLDPGPGLVPVVEPADPAGFPSPVIRLVFRSALNGMRFLSSGEDVNGPERHGRAVLLTLPQECQRFDGMPQVYA